MIDCHEFSNKDVPQKEAEQTTVRSVLPGDHDGFLFTIQIANRTYILRFFVPHDEDYQDFYSATQQLNNSTKRWGYV